MELNKLRKWSITWFFLYGEVNNRFLITLLVFTKRAKITGKLMKIDPSTICCFWISKLLYLDFQILLSTEIVTRLSHDHVALFKTFRGTAQKCARQTINHVASRIKQAQLQLFD